jgi:U11/U12 small nuclear ribonucleoprotein SNRNP65
MKCTAFTTFSDNDAASVALKRLHQLEILGCKLSVEFSKPNFQKLHPSFLDNEGKKQIDSSEDGSNEKKENVKSDPPPLPETVNNLDSKLNVNYPLNPKLKYIFPPPSVSILTNIANALASVPKFYVQVLHLMNKMNIPAPFGTLTSTPPIAPEQPVNNTRVNEQLGEDIVEEEEMVMSSEEESELESDSGEVQVKPILPLKRQKKRTGYKTKRPKLQKITAATKAVVSTQIKPEDVFEPVDGQGSKKIEFKLQSGITKAFGQSTTSAMESGSQPEDILDVLEKMPTVGGFGKIEPTNVGEKQKDIESGASDSEELSEFVSSSELRRNRLSEREMREYNVFKNYDPGEPSSRLYIKNLHRHVTEKELKYIFGRYVDWSDETEVNMFDVRLMTEGRMKGQAFVTLGSDQVAARALKRTNGYLLHDRPMVVNFARSAKAKEPAEKDSSKKPEDNSPQVQSDKRQLVGKDNMDMKLSSSELGTAFERNDHRHSNANAPSNFRTGSSSEYSRNKGKPVLGSRTTEKHSERNLNMAHCGGSDQSSVPSHTEDSDSAAVIPICAASGDLGIDVLPDPVFSNSAKTVENLVNSSQFENVNKSYPTDDLVTLHPNMSSDNLEIHISAAAGKPATPPYFADGSETPPHVSCPYFADGSEMPPHVSENSATPHMGGNSFTPPQIADSGHDTDVAESSVEDERFVTFVMLEMNRLSENEKLENKVFKNYKRGEPNCKLYVKNLNHKLVTEDDIVYIFGKFLQDCAEDVMAGLDIKLLKEGRMKGQAFITYQTTAEAEKALDFVHGYKLHDKPMVIQFGRS